MELQADDRELVERAQAHGDMDAFETLYRRYVGPIHAFAYRRSGSQAVAEDVTSATFERALVNLGTFRWKGAGFGAWLHRIAASELADQYREQARTRALVQAAPVAHGGPADEPVLAAADAALVRSALAGLNPRYQEVVSLRYLAGLSAAEAASAMGVPRAVLAVTLHRALRALAREIESRGGAS